MGAGAGKVVLVTGGGTGIGAAVARQLSLAGDQVVICGRREAPLRAARWSRSAGRRTPTRSRPPSDGCCPTVASYVNGVVLPVDGGSCVVDPGTVALDPRVSIHLNPPS